MSMSDRERGVLARLEKTEAELGEATAKVKEYGDRAVKEIDRANSLQEQLLAARRELDEARTNLMEATAILLNFAAECHRGKWEFEDDCTEAFTVLHNMGDRAKKEFDKLRSRC